MKAEVATLQDVPRLVEMGRLLHDTSSYAAIPFNEEKVADLLSGLISGTGAVFVTRKDGRIIGAIAGAVGAHWFSDELHGFEFSFFIDPEARNGFTALRLMNAFTRWCALRGAKSVRMGVTTGIHHESTAALYRLAGFKNAGVLLSLEV